MSMGKVSKYVKGHNIKPKIRAKEGEYTATQREKHSHRPWPLSSLMDTILSLTLQYNCTGYTILNKAVVTIQNNGREILQNYPASLRTIIITKRNHLKKLLSCLSPMARGTSPFAIKSLLLPPDLGVQFLGRGGSCLTPSCLDLPLQDILSCSRQLLTMGKWLFLLQVT